MNVADSLIRDQKRVACDARPDKQYLRVSLGDRPQRD